MRILSRKILPFLILSSFLLTSCASFETHVPVSNNNDGSNNATPATGWEGNVTVCSFLWGAIPGDPAIVNMKTECGVHDVKITRDFWQGLCSILTLGAVSPMTVQWKLGSAPSREGPPL